MNDGKFDTTLQRPEDLPDVRPFLEDAGYEELLLVRHDLSNIDRMLAEDRPDGVYDYILRAGSRGVRHVAIFEATNSKNAVFQRLYRYNGNPPRKLEGTADFDWELSLEHIPETGLENRLVIPEWPAPRSYAIKNKDTHFGSQLLHEGHRALDPPPERLADAHLSFRQLKVMNRHNHLYQDWQQRLTEVDGVYLIRDTNRGHIYIGSTWGEEGIWGRWRGYAMTGHNNNTLLKPHVDRYSTSDFVLCLLETWPRGSREQDQCVDRESLWKSKLGSRKSASGPRGLNMN